MKTLPCLQQQRRSLLFLGCLMALNLPAQEFPGCVSSSNLLGQFGRPVISQWKPRGVNFCLDPRGLSSLLPVSQLSVRGVTLESKPPSSVLFPGVLWSHLTETATSEAPPLPAFIFPGNLLIREGPDSSICPCICRLHWASLQISSRGVSRSQCVQGLWRDVRAVFSDLPGWALWCWVQHLFPPCPQCNRGSLEAVGHSLPWRLTEHMMYENRRIFMTDEGTRGQLKQGSGTGKGKWERTA